MLEFLFGAFATAVLFFAFPSAAVWVNAKIAKLWAAINKPRPAPPSDDDE